MSSQISLLSPQYKGKFATVWIAATRGVDKVSKKQILDVNINNLCQEIALVYITLSHKPQERLSLSLAAKLVNGTIKIFRKQVVLLQENVIQCLTIPSTIYLKPPRPAGTKKKPHKSGAVHSDEIVRSEEMVPLVEGAAPTSIEYAPELNITDRDVEKALSEQPVALVEDITLREEVPLRLTQDEPILFGDEGFIESKHFLLENGPPFTEEDRIEFEEKVSRDISRIGSQVEVEQGRVPLIERQPAVAVDLEKIMIAEKEKQVQEESPPVEPPRKKRLKSDAKKLEMPAEDKNQKHREELLTSIVEEIPQEPVTRRKTINLEKVTVKLNSKFRSIKLRCDNEDLEIFEEPAYSPINLKKFENILDECQDMLICQRISFEGVRRQEGSTMSRATGSRSRLTRQLQGTPTIVTPSGELVEELKDTKEPIEARRQLPERQSQTSVEIPTMITPASPSKTTDIREREPTILETIVDLPPVVSAEPIALAVTDAVPKLTSQEQKKNVNARKRKITRLVTDWNYSSYDLTIEDVAEKPLNRLNMAVAFNDLLDLYRLQYVRLSKKENSLELNKIEKGARLL